MSASIFTFQRRVTYAECAPGNHVYYARYLEFLEEARGEFFRHLGNSFLLWQQQNTVFPVVECRLQFLCPARYDDLLSLQVWLTHIQRVRLCFAYRILKDPSLQILRASTVHACASGDEKLKRIPESLKQAILPYLHENSSDSQSNVQSVGGG